jgi:hypothetical protein
MSKRPNRAIFRDSFCAIGKNESKQKEYYPFQALSVISVSIMLYYFLIPKQIQNQVKHFKTMADLSVNFAGIKSPNPFLAGERPPTNMGSMVERAFDAGWGGAVWKTLGEPIVNVCSRSASWITGESDDWFE